MALLGAVTDLCNSIVTEVFYNSVTTLLYDAVTEVRNSIVTDWCYNAVTEVCYNAVTEVRNSIVTNLLISSGYLKLEYINK